MGLQSAFVTAVSGLSATGRALSEIGNNIANSETVGFKSSRISFGDLFGATIGGGGMSASIQEGRGVSVIGPTKTLLRDRCGRPRILWIWPLMEMDFFW